MLDAVYGRLADATRSVPVPPRARAMMSTVVLRRPYRITVPVESLLLGAQGGLTAREYARRTGDLLWPSTRLIDGPHVALLRDTPEDPGEILRSPYGRMARRCAAASGHFFGARDDAEIVELALAFRSRRSHFGAVSRSTRLDPVLVAPVRWSRCYQVLDGHHRLARAVTDGQTWVRVVAKWLPVTTPLQEHLLRMSWIRGGRELYQPVDAPELGVEWPVVRACADRLDAMLAFLGSRGIRGSYLDVASCYGWFVAKMAAAGFDARGIELDPRAVPLGRAVYGLPEGAVRTGDACELLGGMRADVVSCFSLLHHFVLGRGPVSARELLWLLDRAAGRVLFLDTGQEHEKWFSRSLRGWNPATIKDFLLRQTSFDEIVDLGPDEDDKPPYNENYGRHLFACVRNS